MPNFLVTGRFRDSVIQDFCNISVGAREELLSDLAERLGGKLTDFFLVGGTWSVAAIFDAPAHLSSELIYMLLSSNVFDVDFKLRRVMGSHEFDHSFSHSESLTQVWTSRTIGGPTKDPSNVESQL